jgi:hypothetical protein
MAARGELEPFVLVVEGSIPNENINGDGYWTSMGNDPATGEPVTLNQWIDRLAPRAWHGGRRPPGREGQCPPLNQHQSPASRPD